MNLQTRYLMWLTEVPASTVANVKHRNRVCLDGKQHAILVWLVAIKELTHLERKVGIFRREHAAFGHLGE